MVEELVLTLISGCVLILILFFKFIVDFIFCRKELIAYFKDEWITMDDGKLDYKVNFWLIPIKYRPNPKALEESMKRQYKAYTKAKAENPGILP